MYQVLVVDDESHVTDAISMLLSEQTDIDIEVFVANSAREALSLLEAQRIDLMLTDITMPDMSGIELLEQTSRRWPLCQVVMLTGYSDFQYAYEAFRLKAAGFLLKTEPEKVLVATIRETLMHIKARFENERVPDAPGEYAEPNPQLIRLMTADARQRSQALQALGFEPPCAQLVLCLSSQLSTDGSQELDARQLDALVRRHIGDRLLHGVYAQLEQAESLWVLQMKSEACSLPLVSSILETVQNICRSTYGREISFFITLSASENLPVALSRLKAAQSQADDRLGSVVSLSGVSPSAFSAENTVSFVKQYIRQHMAQGVTISMLSQASGYNADYLSRIFRNATGETIGQYLNAYRMRVILSLMREEGLSVDEIARRTGFASRSYFNRFVRRATGMNPKTLRMSLSDAQADGPR